MTLTPRILLPLAGLLLLGGCATTPKPGDDPAYVAARPLAAPLPPPVGGGLYRAGYDMRLFEDPIARNVGDILTITLIEQTAAKKKADTAVTKDTDVGAAAALSASGINTQPWSTDITAQTERDFEGSGESEQSNSLKGNISVVVADVLPNGNLVVQGEKWIALNQGEEYIRITGLVRPQDIAPDNTVPSFLVADARISYGGTGPIADANTLGWLTRFFISAVFPF